MVSRNCTKMHSGPVHHDLIILCAMTLLIGCLLIYHFGLPWWLYPLAAVLWGGEMLIKIVLWSASP